MALRDIFAKLIGRGEAAAIDNPMEHEPPPQKTYSPVMQAIHSSDLDKAITLMQGGAEVDFEDPIIEVQMRVATYDTNFEFLQVLEDRRQIQAAAEKEKLKAAEVSAAQTAEGEKLQTLAGITTAMSGGASMAVAAPQTASFTRKPGG
jgi:hypothetical protein